MLSQKCQYALRAVLELARHHRQGPVRAGEIARAAAIPSRFLEVILNELRQAGFIESRRGSEGGYLLQQSPSRLTVGAVIRFFEGSLAPVACMNEIPASVFLSLWERVHKAVSDIYDGTTFQDLLDQECRMRSDVLSYAI